MFWLWIQGLRALLGYSRSELHFVPLRQLLILLHFLSLQSFLLLLLRLWHRVWLRGHLDHHPLEDHSLGTLHHLEDHNLGTVNQAHGAMVAEKMDSLWWEGWRKKTWDERASLEERAWLGDWEADGFGLLRLGLGLR